MKLEVGGHEVRSRKLEVMKLEVRSHEVMKLEVRNHEVRSSNELPGLS